jgi:aminoglycoside phosphotransferase (APT) family kinase protein
VPAADADGLAYEGPPLWLHGDLHPANLLVSRGRITGVIDFGDITSGDPAGPVGGVDAASAPCGAC